MPSNIDITKPIYGTPTTQSVRDNFEIAQIEITDLQAITEQGPFVPLKGGIMTGYLELFADPRGNFEAATKQYVDALAFGVSGSLSDAPKDGMFYARGGATGTLANDWVTNPLFTALRVGADKDTSYFVVGADAIFNLYGLSTDGTDTLRYNRSTKILELVFGGVVVVGFSNNAITFGQPLTLAGDPTAALGAATKQYVDSNKTSLAPALNDVGRNLIHNSLFNVWQRGAGPFTLSGNYTADRWQQSFVNGSQSVTAAAIIDASRAQIGDEEASWALANAFVGSATAGSYNLIWQQIEDVRRLAGKTVTVSFYAAALSGAPKLGVSFDQNFGTGGSPSAPVYATGSAVTLSTTWKRYSVPLTLASMAGKTLGSNYDSKTTLILWHSAEATFAARSGGIGVQSDTVFVWGVQLEIGSVATSLEKPEPQQDFAKCQRFYCTIGSVFVSGGAPASGAGAQTYSHVTLPVTMRASPSISVPVASSTNCSGTGATTIFPQGFDLYITALAPGGFYASLGTPLTASADL